MTARHVGSRAAIAMGIGTVGALVAVHLQPDTRDDAVDTAMMWLHLPLLLGAIVAAVATIELHPPFGRDRADAPWLERLRVGPVDGCGTVSLTAALAVAGLGGVLAIGFEHALARDADRALSDVVPLSVPAEGRLDPAHPTLELRVDPPRRCETVELRPLVAFDGRHFAAAHVVVRFDDGADAGPWTLVPGGNLIRASAPLQTIARVTLQLDPTTPAVVLLPSDAAIGRAPAACSARANAATVGASAAFGVAAVLGLAILGRRRLAPPILMLGVTGLLILGTAAGHVPVGPALSAHARDQVAWSTATRAAATGSTLVGILSIAVAAVCGRLRRR